MEGWLYPSQAVVCRWKHPSSLSCIVTHIHLLWGESPSCSVFLSPISPIQALSTQASPLPFCFLTVFWHLPSLEAARRKPNADQISECQSLICRALQGLSRVAKEELLAHPGEGHACSFVSPFPQPTSSGGADTSDFCQGACSSGPPSRNQSRHYCELYPFPVKGQISPSQLQ